MRTAIHYHEPAGISCTAGADIGAIGASVTRGHSSSQGGLRGHSIGDTYPWRVVGYGDGSWAIEDVHGDTLAREYGEDSCKRIHARARAFKVLHPLGYVERTPGNLPANISGPLDEIAARLEGYLLVVGYENGGCDRLRVCPRQDLNKQLGANDNTRTIKVRNHSTGLLTTVSLQWLAYNQHLSISLDLAEFT